MICRRYYNANFGAAEASHLNVTSVLKNGEAGAACKMRVYATAESVFATTRREVPAVIAAMTAICRAMTK